MLETLPQHHQHPQQLQQQQQQQSTFFRNITAESYYLPHAPARQSPLGSRNANVTPTTTILASSSSRCSSLSTSGMTMPTMTTQKDVSGERTDKSNNHNHNNNNALSLFSGNENNSSQQQQTRLSPFSFSSETETTAQKRTSSFEQRYKSRISNPLNRIFSSSSSFSSGENGRRGGALSSLSARAAAKQRDLFLNKMKRDRDEGLFNARGEQLMRMECLTEQKQWGEAMRRDAEGLFQQYHLDEVAAEGEEEMVEDSDQHALDEFLSQEQEMEEALLENIIPSSNDDHHHHHHDSSRNSNNNNNYPAPPPPPPPPPQAIMSSPSRRSDRSSFYGDDDVDYDAIFRDLVDNEHQSHSHSQAPSQDMDMTG